MRLANDSPYGLSASVFSSDVERAKDVALQLDCGAVNINDVISNLMCTTAPMGGWKTSGIGARFGGADGVRKFCRQETIVVPRTNVGRWRQLLQQLAEGAEADEHDDDEDGADPAQAHGQVASTHLPFTSRVTAAYCRRRYLQPVTALAGNRVLHRPRRR